MKILFTSFLTVIAITSYAQTTELCNLNSITDVKSANIDLNLFCKNDTTVILIDKNNKEYSKEKYNVFYQCSNGTVILGNINKKGIKHGRWSFKQKNATGYHGHIKGYFKKGKMHGYRGHGPYTSKYEHGTLIKTFRIPF